MGKPGEAIATLVLLQAERVAVRVFLKSVSSTLCLLEFSLGDQKCGRMGHTHPCENSSIAKLQPPPMEVTVNPRHCWGKFTYLKYAWLAGETGYFLETRATKR